MEALYTLNSSPVVSFMPGDCCSPVGWSMYGVAECTRMQLRLQREVRRQAPFNPGVG